MFDELKTVEEDVVEFVQMRVVQLLDDYGVQEEDLLDKLKFYGVDVWFVELVRHSLMSISSSKGYVFYDNNRSNSLHVLPTWA